MFLLDDVKGYASRTFHQSKTHMKLASFHYSGRDSIGIVDQAGEHVFDLAPVWTHVFGAKPCPPTMIDLIEAGPQVVGALKAALKGDTGLLRDGISIESVKLQPPVRRPSKICCIALNNSANSDRIMKGPKHPAMFTKPASALIGHGGDIEVRGSYGRTHPEPELAVIIGTEGKNIKAEDAYAHVFGYTVHNDITGATMRGEDTFHYRAIHPKKQDQLAIEYVDTWTSYPGRYKGSDTFSCLGPWIVTIDEIPDPHLLGISCNHQGRLITSDSTANLTHHTPEIIAFVSKYMTLWPGDVVSLGTALKKSTDGGAIQNVDLTRLGGPVSVTIESIGTLSNGVRLVEDESLI